MLMPSVTALQSNGRAANERLSRRDRGENEAWANESLSWNVEYLFVAQQAITEQSINVPRWRSFVRWRISALN